MDVKTIEDYVRLIMTEGRTWESNDKLAPQNQSSLEEFVVKNLMAAEEKIAQLEEELQEKNKKYQKMRRLYKMIRDIDKKEIQRLEERVCYLEQQIRLLGGKIGSEGEVFCERRKD